MVGDGGCIGLPLGRRIGGWRVGWSGWWVGGWTVGRMCEFGSGERLRLGGGREGRGTQQSCGVRACVSRWRNCVAAVALLVGVLYSCWRCVAALLLLSLVPPAGPPRSLYIWLPALCGGAVLFVMGVGSSGEGESTPGFPDRECAWLLQFGSVDEGSWRIVPVKLSPLLFWRHLDCCFDVVHWMSRLLSAGRRPI